MALVADAPRTRKVRCLAVSRRGAYGTLPGPCSVVSFSDPDCRPAVFADAANVKRRKHFKFHDIDEPMPRLTAPTLEDAQACLAFIDGDQTGLIVCQCEAGVGRSVATAAALCRIAGGDDSEIRKAGKYNRRWYRLLLEAAGVKAPVEPLVSIVVRVKYPVDRLQALLLSLQRQRYDNWEAVIVTDGPDANVHHPAWNIGDPRIQNIIQTPERRGRWGHPYRALGIANAKGAYIGLTNDDNYYTPGYLEQMAAALDGGADLVLCDMVHAYSGWGLSRTEVTPDATSADVGNWLARRELLEAVPWQGADFTSDSEHVARMARAAKRVEYIHKPLFVKC